MKPPHGTDREPEPAAPLRSGAACLTSAERVQATRTAIDTIMAMDPRDIEDIPGLVDLWDDFAKLIDDLCATPAVDADEVVAKADLAMVLAGSAGDQGAKIALSLASDILASRRTERPRVP